MKVMLLIPPTEQSGNVARDLIYGCWCKGKRIAGVSFPPITILTVGTVLREAGHDVELIDAPAHEMPLKKVQEKATEFDFALVLTSTMTIVEDAATLRALKESNPSLKTAVYGGHVTAQAETSLLKGGIDFVLRNDAEFTVRDLIHMAASEKQWSQVKSISYLENGIVQHTQNRSPLAMDELPIPDRSMLDIDTHYFNPLVKRMPYTTMFTTRGCPAKCTFCSSPTFYGEKVRMKSAEKILDEMEDVAAKGYKEVFFRDEIFTVHKGRILELCAGIKERAIDLTWICSSRVVGVDKEMIQAMKNAGCHTMRFGVESGVQELLDAVKKGITLQDTRNVFKWCREVGMNTHAHMMIGLPGESKETLAQTMDFLKEIKPTTITCGILTVYPGTPLYEEMKVKFPELEIGDGTQQDLTKLHSTSFFNEHFTDLTPDELATYIREIYKKFYLRPSYMLSWIPQIRTVHDIRRLMLAAANVTDYVFGGE